MGTLLGIIGKLLGGRREEQGQRPRSASNAGQLDSRALVAKGRDLHEMGRDEDAIACYGKALQADPGSANAWIEKGISLCMLRRDQEALRCYDHALRIRPEGDEHLWNNMAISLAHLGRREEAILCYDRALSINPRLLDAWFNKAVSEEAIGRREEAAKSYRRFLTPAPAHPSRQVRHALARLAEIDRGTTGAGRR